jgi:hypothetical protein
LKTKQHNKIIDALDIFMKEVGEKIEGREWFVLGSCAALLQGCEIEPRDIELTVREEETAYLIEEALAEYIDIPLHSVSKASGKASALYGQYIIDGVQIEVMANASVKGREKWINESFGEARWDHVNVVEVNGHKVPVTPLELILITNAYRGRKERVYKVAEVLKAEGYNNGLVQKLLKQNLARGEKKQWVLDSLNI